MSRRSYRHNVALGVTGPNTNTCLPASLEILSEEGSLSPRTYRMYDGYFKEYSRREIGGQAKRLCNPMMREMYNQVLWDLEGLQCCDIEFRRAHTLPQFARIIFSLLNQDARIALDLDTDGDGTYHSVSLLPQDTGIDRFRLASTWIPRNLQGARTLPEIFDYVAQDPEPPRIRYPFNNANITALPPED